MLEFKNRKEFLEWVKTGKEPKVENEKEPEESYESYVDYPDRFYCDARHLQEF